MSQEAWDTFIALIEAPADSEPSEITREAEGQQFMAFFGAVNAQGGAR